MKFIMPSEMPLEIMRKNTTKTSDMMKESNRPVINHSPTADSFLHEKSKPKRRRRTKG